jgi:pimeloyl-ACP methyl ester carboxylesterase
VVLGVLFTGAGTRGDEADYRGPRIASDGAWLLQTRDSLAEEAKSGVVVDAALQGAAERRAVALVARDGVKLRGFLVEPRASDGAPRFQAVLVHGLYRGALEIETPAAMLRDLGGEVLLLEMRNHGGSARAKTTFGRDESLDVLSAVDYLRQRPGARDRPLVIFAVSLGTAAAALATPRIPDLAGLALDAPMDDLESLARRELKSGPMLWSVRDPWASVILWSARFIGGVPVHAIRPGDALAKLPADVAVLLIGAGKDERMPPATVRALFEQLPTAPDRKELWIEPEATHGKVWVKAPDEYRRRLTAFVARAVGPETTPAAERTVTAAERLTK